jgi:ABC-2 type transport system ATP-binding protein
VLTEHHGLYNRMYADEYLSFFAQLYRLDPRAARARAQALLGRFDLAGAGKRRLGEYSKGMRQKLALIRVMLHEPEVLVLDEPTSAMDPASVRVVRNAIAELRDGRHAIVLCTHNLHEAEELSDRIAVVSQGRIIAQGTPAELKTRLLGPAVYELRSARPLGPAADVLAAQLEVVASGPDWLRFRSPDPARLHPELVARLAAHDVPLVSLSEKSRSLEDVYLEIVSAEPPARQQPVAPTVEVPVPVTVPA